MVPSGTKSQNIGGIKMYAIVKFKNSDRKYTYQTDIENLVEGEKIWVEANGEEVKARFDRYIPEEFVTARPKAKITSRRFDEVTEQTKSRTPQHDLVAAGKLVVGYIRRSTLAQKWVTRQDIINELAEHGHENVSFESVIKHAKKLSDYVNQFQKNAYIYKKREVSK
jgi:hypothetical protein